MKHQPVKQGQTTTPGTSCPTLCEKCVGSLTSPANKYREDAGDGAYGLSSLSEKTRTSNHLQVSLQRQHILLSYFKTLSVFPFRGSNLRPAARQSGAQPIELINYSLKNEKGMASKYFTLLMRYKIINHHLVRIKRCYFFFGRREALLCPLPCRRTSKTWLC